MVSISLGKFEIHFTLTRKGEIMRIYPDNLYANAIYEKEVKNQLNLMTNLNSQLPLR